MKPTSNQTEQLGYTEKEGIRYRIPAEIPDYSDANGKTWAEVSMPGQSVELQEERQKLYDQLVAEFRYKNDIYEWEETNLHVRQYFDDTVWEIRNKVYEMDHCGVTHFQTRVVFGYINSTKPVFGIQYLLEQKFELVDGTVHTFEVWVNSENLKIEALKGHSLNEPQFCSGINHIDEDGDFLEELESKDNE